MNQGSYHKLFPFDIQKHIQFMIDHQFAGGWSEEIAEEAVPSPQVTSQMIIGLLPHLAFSYPDSLKARIQEAVKTAVKYLDSMFKDQAWSDHSKVIPLIDETGAVITAILLAETCGVISLQTSELSVKLCAGAKFLMNEQNRDGGWGIRQGNESRIQFTYWSAMALLAYQESSLCDSDEEKQLVCESLESCQNWLQENFKANGSKAFSVREGSFPNAVATAMGIELFKRFNLPFDNQEVVNFLRESQYANGRWEVQVDTITFEQIPRRVYQLSDWPRVVECLITMHVQLDGDLMQDALRNIKELQFDAGGFKHETNVPTATGWFTAQTLKMLAELTTFIDETRDTKHAVVPSPRKIHRYAKAALMIGRFRPPHIGHCVGLKAILFGSGKEFSLPEKVLKDLRGIEKVFIGITRYPIDSNNPWAVGEVQDIWRAIIDDDEDLQSKSNLIEIVSCPASRDQTNVARAIDELTSRRDSIIVVSGNDRVLDQCGKNHLRYCRFIRYDESLRGSLIRRIIADIDWDNPEASISLIEDLKKALHPSAYKLMLEKDLFKKAQKIMKAI